MAELNRFDIELDELRDRMKNCIAKNLDNHERVEFQETDFLSTNENAIICGVEKEADGTTNILYEENLVQFTYPLWASMESHDTLNMIIERMPEK
jgi:hypothetical protein